MSAAAIPVDDLANIKALREACWSNGWPVLAVQTARRGDPKTGKAPVSPRWQITAKEDPPEVVRIANPVPWAANTGIACAGLRPFDIDVDDQTLVDMIIALAFAMLGVTIVRRRANSPRVLLVYIAAEGEPPKRVCIGRTHSSETACKVEILGKGQQFVAYGEHHSGVALQWPDGGPRERALADVPAVTEAQVTAFLAKVAEIIDAEPAEPKPRPRGKNGTAPGPDDNVVADIADITAALALIPNDGPPDWESWNSVGLAIWASTGGSGAGWVLWRDWSARNPANDPETTAARWAHYAKSPPDRTGAGKLFRLAAEASPGWRRPSSLRAKTPPPETGPEQREANLPDSPADEHDGEDGPPPENADTVPDGEAAGTAAEQPEREPYGPPTLDDLTLDDLAAMDEVAFARIVKAKAALMEGMTATNLRDLVKRKRREAEKAAKTRERTEPKAEQLPPLTEPERDALLEHLADLDEDDYDLERDTAAAKMGGIRLSSLDKLVEKIRQARADAAAVAAAAARRKQPPAPPPDDTPEVTALIAEFNAKFFVLREHGKAIIYAPGHDPILNRRFYERIGFEDLNKLYLNRTVLCGFDLKTGEPIYKPVAHVWLHHRKRAQYVGGMVFDPSERKQDDDVFNLWRGFGVTPRSGTWALFRQHLHIIVCDGNTTHFEYLMNWMADMVQRPAKQGEVAVVMRSKVEGTGKSLVMRTLRHICGQHGFVISNSKHLTGNFNAHQRDCIFLGADEALFAGDPSHVGIMKSIVTEPFLVVEPKFRDAAQSPNYLHLMMATNADWAIPASLRSRRWLVLDVNESRASDHAYFAAIQHELDHGGYEAMLHELLNRDISQVNLRDVPVTAALVDQRTRSLDTHTAWWLDCLSRGYVFRSRIGLEDVFHIWINPISTDLMFDSYTEYRRAHHERRPLHRVHFGRWLRTVGCAPTRPDGEVIVGEHLVDVTTTKTTKVEITRHTGRIAEVVKQKRARSYIVGDLDKARTAFTEATKLAVRWEDDDEEAGDKP
jgi:hypothetical protein